MEGDWWSPVAITSSAGKFAPISTATHNGDSVVHTEQLQLQISREEGGASILCCGGLLIATGGGWWGVITSSAEKCSPRVSTVVTCCTATGVRCANASLDGVQFRAAVPVGSVVVDGERPSTLHSCD